MHLNLLYNRGVSQMKRTTIVDIRVDTDWLAKVRAAADRKGISFSQFIRMAVDYYLNRYKR